jgi:hypothetical protein
MEREWWEQQAVFDAEGVLRDAETGERIVVTMQGDDWHEHETMATFDENGRMVYVDTGEPVQFIEGRVTENTYLLAQPGIGTSPSKSGLHPKRKRKS